MKVFHMPVTDIPSLQLTDSKAREYSVSLHYEDEVKKLEFKYDETAVNEFMFERSDFAFSGAEEHHYFGVVKNNNYYWETFSKGALGAQKPNVFWEKFANPMYIDESKGTQYSFHESINLLFAIPLYWHWFNEDLPLFKYMLENGNKIITNKLNTWQLESLEYLDIPKGLHIEIDTPATVFNTSDIHTFSYPSVSYRGKGAAWVPLWLKETLVPTTKETGKRVYIGRGEAKARVVENEEDIVSMLKPLGFDCILNSSSLTMEEKLNLFHSADVVISPTGGNLTHVHAMRPGTKVIDFNHSFEVNEECGWNNIGTAVGVDWHTFIAETGSANERSKPKNKNLIPDLDLLMKVLKRLDIC